MTKTIKKIFSDEFGFNPDQLNSLARILYHYEFDGIERRSIPNDSNLKEILDNEINEEDLNRLLQENIFQKIRGSGERQQVDPSNKFRDETKLQLMQDFEKIGFVDEVLPNPDKKYESVIIYGAAQKGMENRLNDFLEHFLPKINENPKEIFFLVGKRDAWLDSESFAKEVLLKKINDSPERKNEAIKTKEELDAEIEKIILDEQRKKQVTHFKNKYGVILPEKGDINKEILLEKINRSPKINGINEKTRDDLDKEIKFISKITLSEKRRLQVVHFTQKYKIEFPTETDIAEKIFESKKKLVNDFDITSVDNENSARIKDLVNNIKITIINAEKKPDGSRPDTTDTLRAFIENVKSREDFNFDAVLAISNQPNVTAQALALRIDKGLCGIDVVGKEGSREVGQLNILACEFAGGFYRYLALSKEQQQGIKSDQLLRSQGAPSSETVNRKDASFAKKLDGGVRKASQP